MSVMQKVAKQSVRLDRTVKAAIIRDEMCRGRAVRYVEYEPGNGTAYRFIIMDLDGIPMPGTGGGRVLDGDGCRLGWRKSSQDVQHRETR